MNAFVDMTKYVLALDGDLCLLSERIRISQDPIENYFGQQRDSVPEEGEMRTLPSNSVSQCIRNASALRVQKSQALDPVIKRKRKV